MSPLLNSSGYIKVNVYLALSLTGMVAFFATLAVVDAGGDRWVFGPLLLLFMAWMFAPTVIQLHLIGKDIRNE
jgi:hypothetical protein